MPNTREKLIELLSKNATCDMLGIPSCAECPYWDKMDCYSQALADHLIANGVTVQEWISVKDRLPEESGDYLALTDGGFIERLSYSERHNAFNADDRLLYAECAIPCTHWMPLPQPPKGE